MYYRNNQKGYVAVTAAIIMVLIVMTVAIMFSHSNFLGRFDSLGLEQKDISREAAEGCLEHARLKLKLGTYGGNETVTVGSSTCSVLSVTLQGNTRIIQATASSGNRTTNLELTITSTTLNTVSLTEKDHF